MDIQLRRFGFCGDKTCKVGSVDGEVSLALGTLTAGGVVQVLLNMQFRPELAMGLLTVLVRVLVSLFMGLFGTWRVRGRKTAPFFAQRARSACPKTRVAHSLENLTSSYSTGCRSVSLQDSSA